MDFPVIKRKSPYESSSENKVDTLGTPQYVAVPGASGPAGPRGEVGLTGKPGAEGKAGKKGDTGERGIPGKDGETYMPIYKQRAGWARYSDSERRQVPLGPTRGADGWVSFYVDAKGASTEESYLPEKHVSLYNRDAKRINLKHLAVGTQVTVTYDFDFSTMSSNTEIWLRSVLPSSDSTYTSFVALLKYEYDYSFSVTHHITVTSESDKTHGLICEARSDANSIFTPKSITISVS